MISEEPVDYITHNTDWLFASMALVNVRFTATTGELIDFFQSLNKANPFPDLYMRDPDQIRKEIVEGTVAIWHKRYPDHFSASRKPVRPNINRDTFIEVVDTLYEKYNTEDNPITIEDMSRRLDVCQHSSFDKYGDADTPKSAIQKCKKTGCWLFMFSPDIIIEQV
jgi:hypothetical protein